MQPYFELGNHTFPITTAFPEVQIWFDRGLAWCYGFNHEEAEVCFRKAIDLDPNCAMAYWGLAYAAGPNYNMPWSNFTEDELPSMVLGCYEVIQRALSCTDGATPLEGELINALSQRFQASEAINDEICTQWSRDYAAAMRAVCQTYPTNPDVCALTAEALMIQTPWQLWDVESGEPCSGADTLEAKELLENAMARLEEVGESPHAALIHFYIHLMEMSPVPEVALPASRKLGELIPDSGHLRHMASHIFVLCGLYEESLAVNEVAHRVNEKYAAYAGANNFYTIYRAHDIHFVMYSAMFLGQSQRAISAANEMAAMITPDLAHGSKELFLNYMDGFAAMRVHAYIRFGKWQEILNIPLPDDPTFFCVTTSLLYYAKGVAYAASRKVDAAETQMVLFEDAYQNVPRKRMIFNNEAREILDVAREMLYGEVAYRKEEYELAFSHLRRSVELHDSLKYTEPWVWMQPTRHALAALLLEQNHVEEAAAVYRADLGLDNTLGRPFWHQNNVWSLHGYHECLQRMGQHDEAAAVKPKLDEVLAKADVPITSSCYCRTEHTCCDS